MSRRNLTYGALPGPARRSEANLPVTRDTPSASHLPPGRDVREVRVGVATLWTRPDSPRPLDEPALAADPDLAAWAMALDAPSRLDLVGRTLTQLLMGEPVHVLEERGAWAHVVAPMQPGAAHTAGYPGWLPRHHLGPPISPARGPRAFVSTPTVDCEVDDGSSCTLSFGTALPVESLDDDDATVLLPGGRRARIAVGHVRLGEDGSAPERSPDDILDAATQFLGLRYMWGGTSAWGLDCSGLVHLVFRAFGVRVPRDAVDQAAWVDPVPLGMARPGDLYFFARPAGRIFHVGFVSRTVDTDGLPWMLHAPETGGVLEERPLAPKSPDTLRSAGRVRTHTPRRPGQG